MMNGYIYDPMMNGYVCELNKHLEKERERQEKQRVESERVAVLAARERLTPLEERLGRLLTGIPLEVQRAGLSLRTLQISLRGRWRGNCHPGELGTALRKLGFKRERRWHGDRGFRAVWRKEG